MINELSEEGFEALQEVFVNFKSVIQNQKLKFKIVNSELECKTLERDAHLGATLLY